MEKKRKLSLAKAGVVLVAIPLIIWAYEFGPDPGYCGVPGENGICLASGCHVGTQNPNGGGIKVTFPNGATYTPGVTQQVVVTITDASSGGRAWGFQLTARPASSASTMAGSFTPTDTYTQVMCSQPNFFIFSAVCLAGASAGSSGPPCQASSAPACPTSEPLQYAEHSYAGYAHNRGATGSATYAFNWTPPATNVGNVTIYAAANSGPPTSPATQTGADIYTASFTLTPATATTTAAIADVQNGASFAPASGIVPGSWFTIKGSNLANTTDTWADAIVGGNLPTKLDGVSVSVGGQPAYIYYVSSTQINALAGNVGSGTVTVTANTPNGNVTASANSSMVQPAFFPWPGNYAVTTHNNPGCTPAPQCSWAVKNGTFALATTPAAPGETVILWGTGFGPTTPAAPVGVPVPLTPTYITSSPVSVTVNSETAAVYQNQAFLAPTAAGEYQIAVTIPADIPNGDWPIVATVNGAQSPATMTITVQK